MGITDEFICPLIYAALRKKKNAKELREVDKDDETLLDHLIKQTDGTKKPISSPNIVLNGYADFDLIRDETLNILLASRDTVSAIFVLITTEHTQLDPIDRCIGHFRGDDVS